MEGIKVKVEIPRPYRGVQESFVRSGGMRQVWKAGRRSGKTVGMAIKGVEAFLGICGGCGGVGCIVCDNTGRVKPTRVLYAAPTVEQMGKFWYEVSGALAGGVEAGVFKKNESENYIEVVGSEVRIKGKTAWNANTMRGDWGGLVELDEYQLMNEDVWGVVVQPMLLDINGRCVFGFTPPTLASEGVSKAKDPRHATKLYKRALEDRSGRWEAFHSTSYDNPHLSKVALKELSESGDMSADVLRREIMAEDDEIEASWLVYSKFNEKRCKVKRFEVPESWPKFSGHDFGQANPAALFVAQAKLPLPAVALSAGIRYGDYVAYAEYAPGAGYSAEQHIDRWRELVPRGCEVSVGGNMTTEEDVRRLYGRLGWRIQAPRAARVNAQVDYGIRLFENEVFYVFEDLYKFLGELTNCMWVVNEARETTNKIQNESRWHLLSAFRYLSTALNVRAGGVGREVKVYKE